MVYFGYREKEGKVEVVVCFDYGEKEEGEWKWGEEMMVLDQGRKEVEEEKM